MTEPLSAETLAEIRARVEAATRGPWRWADWSKEGGDDQRWLVAPHPTLSSGDPEVQQLLADHSNVRQALADQSVLVTFDTLGVCIEEDREFIAHARDDLPALLAENARLDQVAEAAIDELEHQREMNQQLGEEIEELRAIVYDVAKAYMLGAIDDVGREAPYTRATLPQNAIIRAQEYVAAHPREEGGLI